MSGLPTLPRGWAWAPLSDFSEVVSGLAKNASRPAAGLRSVPYLRVANVQRGYFDLAEMKEIMASEADLESLLLRNGDLLLISGGDRDKLGRGWVWRGQIADCIHQNHVYRARLRGPGFHPHYVSHYTNGRAAQAYFTKAGQQTTNLASINLSELRALPVPVPPEREQARIVAELDKQFSRLDAAVASLRQAKARLVTARASVLQAAVTGRLVPTEAEIARKEGREYEAAGVLLERVLTGRRRRWKESGSKGKYVGPEPPEISAAPPQGWAVTNVDSCLLEIKAGLNFTCEKGAPTGDEVGIVKVSAVTWGEYDEEESKTIPSERDVDPALLVKKGDFLFSRANTIKLVGACVIAERVTKRILLSDKILRLRFAGGLDRWILHVLRSRVGRTQIEQLASGNQESMRNLGQDRLRAIVLPLPPERELDRIVAEVDRRLSVLDNLARVVDANLARCAALRRGLLDRAFAGRLVAQDPGDEPASVLLARIRKAR